MKWVVALLTILLITLQYKLWLGDGGVPVALELQQEVFTIQQQNLQLEERNQALHAEVTDLKKGLDAIEERARSELGMVAKDETFYQIIRSKK
jgi:cell division protein FtsB